MIRTRLLTSTRAFPTRSRAGSTSGTRTRAGAREGR
jgi:hypothetical protein